MTKRTALALILLSPTLCAARTGSTASTASTASTLIHHYLSVLSAFTDHPVSHPSPRFLLTIEPQSEMPFRGTALAHTTVQHDAASASDTCVLHFTAETVRSPIVLAHEACHCALDHLYIGERGYREFVSPELRTRIEHRANTCGKWLTEHSTRTFVRVREETQP